MTAPPAPAPPGQRLPLAVAALLIAIVLPEAVLQGADLGLWGSARWRPVAYAQGAFWAGLLQGWTPNYAAQPAAMFLTHGFLHGGALHLLFNGVTLAAFGSVVVARIGSLRFLALYAAAMVGGGFGYALLARQPLPMVGASGALFGLAAAFVFWNAADAWRRAPDRARRLRAVLSGLVWPAALLALLNLVAAWGTAGGLAWEAHLGGFVTGLALAPLLDRR